MVTAALVRRRRPGEARDDRLDETGVGRAVGDIFESAGLRPMRITITAGAEVACVGYSDGIPSRFHVAKTILISHLDALLHIGELKFAASSARQAR